MLLVGEPWFGEEERQALSDVIDSNWITMGDRVRAFEAAFSALHGTAGAVAVSSCTAGLHLALAAHGIGPGDEVLVPSLSFVATANAPLYVGATPVFVDIDDITRPQMSVADAETKCTERTRCVILMHYAGFLCPRAVWRDFAGRRGLILVEDAAHAAGADGAGNIGQTAVFSFYGNKNMTTAEGGMVVSERSDILEMVRLMRGHGMTTGTRQRHDSRTPSYDVMALGWNYRMDELRAALGLVQLSKLKAWNAIRHDLAEQYRAEIAKACPEVLVPFQAGREPSADHLLAVVLPEETQRDKVMASLRNVGIQTTIHYPPIHLMTYYRERCPSVSLPRTEQFASRQLTIPLHPKMQSADVRYVVSRLANAVHC